MGAYYNEIDPYAAQWLRNLIAMDLIAPGEVDERSIETVSADDLSGFRQHHFFAGIGVWSMALRAAGWPDDREVWTGSCPCQPFSAAGKGKGFSDPRHLWPVWWALIAERRPSVVLGEQVSRKDGHAWLDLVQADLEGGGYACGAVSAPSCGFGAPHIRERLYFAAYDLGRDGAGVTLGATLCAGLEGHAGNGDRAPGRAVEAGSTPEAGGAGEVEHAAGGKPGDGASERGGELGLHARDRGAGGPGHQGPRPDGPSRIERPGPTNGFWRDADWLRCRDGRWRPVEPGAFPLAHGLANRGPQLRAIGNAINLAQATEFVRAVMEFRP